MQSCLEPIPGFYKAGGACAGLRGQQVLDCRAQECLLEITAAAPEAHSLQCLAPGRVPMCTCTTLLV